MRQLLLTDTIWDVDVIEVIIVDVDVIDVIIINVTL